VVAAVLAILLIAPMAYMLLPAIAGAKAKIGLLYAAARCATSGRCLTVARQSGRGVGVARWQDRSGIEKRPSASRR